MALPAELPDNFSNGNPCILLVDDDINVLAGLKDILEDDGCLVYTATTAAEASDRLMERHYNLAVADFSLPDSSGLELARQFRIAAPWMNIILISGHSHVEKPSSPNYDTFLQKPVDPDQIRKIVRDLCNAQRDRLGIPQEEPSAPTATTTSDKVEPIRRPTPLAVIPRSAVQPLPHLRMFFLGGMATLMGIYGFWLAQQKGVPYVKNRYILTKTYPGMDLPDKLTSAGTVLYSLYSQRRFIEIIEKYETHMASTQPDSSDPFFTDRNIQLIVAKSYERLGRLPEASIRYSTLSSLFLLQPDPDPIQARVFAERAVGLDPVSMIAADALDRTKEHPQSQNPITPVENLPVPSSPKPNRTRKSYRASHPRRGPVAARVSNQPVEAASSSSASSVPSTLEALPLTGAPEKTAPTEAPPAETPSEDIPAP